MENIFYPELERRKEYSKKTDGKYYLYSHYYDEIEEDCKKRCVYCDTTKRELGFDNLQLDHFKPQDDFKELINNPFNLVTACAGCNRSKSAKWLTKKTKEEIFIDPFESNYKDFLSIADTGFLNPKKPPAEYFIHELKLNRQARVFTRLLRIMKYKVDCILDKIKNLTLKLYEECNRENIDIEKIRILSGDLVKLNDNLDQVKKVLKKINI